MQTTLKKYRHLVFILLLGSYLFSVFQYYSVKLIHSISHLTELNNFGHQYDTQIGHEHKLIKKISLEEKENQDKHQFYIELEERVESIDIINLDNNKDLEDKPLNNFHYTNLKGLFISKSPVPPPQFKG